VKSRELKLRLQQYWYVCAVLLALLLVRLAVVQFVQNEKYETASKSNRIRLVSIPAPRGEIRSRDGLVLAKNRLVFSVSLAYAEAGLDSTVVERLAAILGTQYPQITADYIRGLVEQQRYRLYEPVTIVRDVDWPMVVRLEEQRRQLPGVTVAVEPLRYYPEGTLAGHLLGYVRAIDAEELAAADRERYDIDDVVGKDGVEKTYESELKGNDGARRVEVDVRGRPVRELVTLQAEPGNNLELTIDSRLQRVLEKSIEETLAYDQQKYNRKAKVAAAVLLDVKSGAVLAMASYPAFNPNDFIGFMDSATEAYYYPQGSYDPLNPGAATNRVLRALYPPGSTFKPITALAALESGEATAEEKVTCRGSYWVKPYIKCTAAHGSVNLARAMAVSCNTYFQEMGRRAGHQGLIAMADQLGLGKPTGIDLPGEKAGLLPTPEWKRETNAVLVDRKYDRLRQELEDKYARLLAEAKDEAARAKVEKEERSARARLEAEYRIDYRFNTTWQAFDTFNMSIGQGNNSYTVLQLASYVAALANGGQRMQPFVVRRVLTPSGQLVRENHPRLLQRLEVDAANLEAVRQAMLQVTQPGGTGYALFAGFPAQVRVAAKTGTAQTGRKGDVRNKEFHGVFVAFAPFDDPQVAFAGVVEYGQHGSTSAGLIARDVLEQYFNIKDHLAPAEAPREPTGGANPAVPASPPVANGTGEQE
jgi:penicillin-binding protein 2